MSNYWLLNFPLYTITDKYFYRKGKRHEPIQGVLVFLYLFVSLDEIAKVSRKRRVLEKERSELSRIIQWLLWHILAILMPQIY